MMSRRVDSNDKESSVFLSARPHAGIESPGSSVFDLPYYNPNSNAPHVERPSEYADPHRHETVKAEDYLQRNQGSSSFLVISGGTGGNAICSAFENQACYILPVSDDGGSSSEIIRVLGGPSIGDIRSRLIRLIPPGHPPSPLEAIRALLAYRLPTQCTEREAREEWRDIVEGKSPLWLGIPMDRKETIRGFLVYFESEVLKRAHKNFSFLNGSIGNYFLAAAQNFFRSLPSAIFLFSSITQSQANILPVIVTNHTVTIAAELENGEKLVGQCEISHPSPQHNTVEEEATTPPIDGADVDVTVGQKVNIMYKSTEKDEPYEKLHSRISRLYYINSYGNEIQPHPNPDYISHLSSDDILVYSCGSLWTSIIPCLSLRGVASAIARSPTLRAKVLLLNAHNDRETDGYNAVDYINAIVRTLNGQYHPQPYGLGSVITIYPVSAFITHAVHLKGTAVAVDVEQMTKMGIRCIQVDPGDTSTPPMFNAACIHVAMDDILSDV